MMMISFLRVHIPIVLKHNCSACQALTSFVFVPSVAAYRKFKSRQSVSTGSPLEAIKAGRPRAFASCHCRLSAVSCCLGDESWFVCICIFTLLHLCVSNERFQHFAFLALLMLMMIPYF